MCVCISFVTPVIIIPVFPRVFSGNIMELQIAILGALVYTIEVAMKL